MAFGVCCDSGIENKFRYIAGLSTTTDIVPEGMETISLAAHRYAVFEHDGHISDFPAFVHMIWNSGLKNADLKPACAPNFEYYDSRFNPRTGEGIVEVWVPIV